MIKIYAGIAAAVIAFGGGWTVRDWYQASVDLKQVELLEEIKEAQREPARLVEKKIQELRKNEKTIVKWRVKVVERDVYNFSCLDTDGLRIIKDLAAGRTRKPASKVP
tara:strand:- start:17537 stop:17860 length:324 start_codon:yes stop_codon:yes gene_type:complete